MKLKCDYEIGGQGTLDVDLSQIDDEDLTPEGVADWLDHEAGEEGQMNLTVRLQPGYTKEQLAEAIKKEVRKQKRGD